MTRLNLVPPRELTDQHLFAEWRELKMVPRSLQRSLRSRRNEENVLNMVPRTFRLDTGHVSFFYDKAAYLNKRYRDLTDELLVRGVHNFNHKALWDPLNIYGKVSLRFWKMYEPSRADMEIVRERIRQRIALQPEFYRKCGKPII